MVAAGSADRGGGAQALREGGNAFDAAVTAMLASFTAESLLTGLGAGGFMLVAPPTARTTCSTSSSRPAAAASIRPRAASWSRSRSSSTRRRRSSTSAPPRAACPGTAAGLWEIAQRFGTMPFTELAAPGVRYAREGVPVLRMQAYVFKLLEPVVTTTRRPGAVRAGGPAAEEGELFRFPELATRSSASRTTGPTRSTAASPASASASG